MTNITHLYKYGRFNKYSKSLFSTAKIYLCAADKLNDPLKCRPLHSFGGTKKKTHRTLDAWRTGAKPDVYESQGNCRSNEIVYGKGKHKAPAMLAKL